MDIPDNHDPLRETRRQFLGRAAMGAGNLALAGLLNPQASAEYAQHAARTPHFAPRVKRVIHLCMAGGPSHLETFDYKPELARLDGQPMPKSFTKGQPIAQLQGSKLRRFAPQHPFKRYGESQQEISTILPHIGGIADDICIILSMVTEQINHDPAHTFMNTGSAISGRPNMGSWTLYGLGSESSDLPGFVVLVSVGGAQGPAHRGASVAFGFSGKPISGRTVSIHGRSRALHRRPAWIYPGSPTRHRRFGPTIGWYPQ